MSVALALRPVQGNTGCIALAISRIRQRTEVGRCKYSTAWQLLGRTYFDAAADGWFSVDELFVSSDGEPTAGLHIALQAKDRETVDRFHAAALAAGGRDNGPPGERDYHPGYYAAFALDPDGTNVEAVYHGPVERSADSVVFTWESP